MSSHTLNLKINKKVKGPGEHMASTSEEFLFITASGNSGLLSHHSSFQKEELARTRLRELPIFTGKSPAKERSEPGMKNTHTHTHTGNFHILNLFSLTGKSWTGRAASWSMRTEITFLCMLLDFLTTNICMREDDNQSASC